MTVVVAAAAPQNSQLTGLRYLDLVDVDDGVVKLHRLCRSV